MERMDIDWEIIRKGLGGELSDQEKSLLDAWMNDSAENRLYYERAQKYTDQYYWGDGKPQVDTNEFWKSFVKHTRQPKSIQLGRILRYAAVVFLPLLLGGIYFLLQKTDLSESGYAFQKIEPGVHKALLVSSDGQQIAMTESLNVKQWLHELPVERTSLPEKEASAAPLNRLFIPRGGEYRMSLPDGTLVVLNSDSRLSFSDSFESDSVRWVHLEGEAFFEVARADKKFVVETDFGSVEVLGTQFNVNAYPDEIALKTTLVEGSVSCIWDEGKRSEKLIPGEQFSLNKATLEAEVLAVNVQACIAWLDGRWIMEGESLGSIMRQAERWYNVEIGYADEALADLKFTGDLERYQDIETLFEIIQLTTDVVFDIDKGTRVVMIREK